jgi:hypothetical protein
VGRQVGALVAVVAARLLARCAPKRICAVLEFVRRGARPATFDQALRARQDVVATSARCAGRYCLDRSLATVLLVRLRGRSLSWHTGVRTPPFAAHAWVEAEGRPVGEPAEDFAYQTILRVPAADHRG